MTFCFFTYRKKEPQVPQSSTIMMACQTNVIKHCRTEKWNMRWFMTWLMITCLPTIVNAFLCYHPLLLPSGLPSLLPFIKCSALSGNCWTLPTRQQVLKCLVTQYWDYLSCWPCSTSKQLEEQAWEHHRPSHSSDSWEAFCASTKCCEYPSWDLTTQDKVPVKQVGPRLHKCTHSHNHTLNQSHTYKHTLKLACLANSQGSPSLLQQDTLVAQGREQPQDCATQLKLQSGLTTKSRPSAHTLVLTLSITIYTI